MHPSLSRPTFAYEQPMATDIKYLENKPGFDEVRERMIRDNVGSTVLTFQHSSMGKPFTRAVSKIKTLSAIFLFTWHIFTKK